MAIPPEALSHGTFNLRGSASSSVANHNLHLEKRKKLIQSTSAGERKAFKNFRFLLPSV